MEISIKMEPRELHELLMLGAAAFGPDEPQVVQVETEPQRALPAAKPKRKKAAYTGNKYPYGFNLDVPAKEIRQWAWANGKHCPKTGVIPKDIIEDFVGAHS
jgi:hypothetical protein